MKKISKTTLAAAVVAGAALLSSTSAFASDGDGQGMPKNGMRGERGDREERPHLVPKEMMEQFREENGTPTEEERELHREERKAHHEERQNELAEFAGVSTDELKESHKNGDSLGDILTQNGKTREDAEVFLTETANEHVSEITEKHNLDEGEIASVQANVSNFVDSILSRWFK